MRLRAAAVLFMLPLLLASAPEASRAAWQENGNLVYSGAVDVNLGYGAIAAIGPGAIITWGLADNYGSFARSAGVKFDLDGAVQWTKSCECSRWGSVAQLAPDGSGGVFAAAAGRDAAAAWYICPSRIYADGSAAGFAIHPFDNSDTPLNPRVIPCGAGGAVFVWDCSNTLAGTGFDIFAQRVDGANARQWGSDGVAVIAAAGDQKMTAVDTDGSNGAIICWQSGGNLYVQRVLVDGSLSWGAGGVSVCAAAGVQDQQRLLADGEGGAFIVWRDARSGTADIYMQRVNSNGAALWAADGVAICTAAGAQEYPVPVVCGGGGAFVAWSDARAGNYDVYAQRVDGGGVPQWTPDGIVVSAGSGAQSGHQMVSDCLGNAIVCWVDGRGADTDIFAQKLDPAGNELWRAGGVPACTAAGDQNAVVMISDGMGGAFVAWRDFRRWSWGDVYAARLREDIIPVETLLRGFSAAVEGAAVRITWTLSEAGRGIEFAVTRTDIASSLAVTIENPAIARERLEYTFVDESCEPGRTYRYRIDATDESGIRTLFETQDITLPGRAFALGQNYPNPFNPATAIGYSVPERAYVTLDVFDAAGRRLARLVDAELPAGTYAAEWNGTTANGQPAASGVYFYRLRAGAFVETRKMTLAR